MKTDLTGKTALVTGASRGIGAAAARRLAAEGAKVAVHYHGSAQRAAQVLADLPGQGHVMIQADLSDPFAAEGLIGQTVERLGRLDILVNNAGVWEFHPIAEVDFDEWKESWDRTINTNLLGPAHLCYFAAKPMIAQGGGKIINISSRGAFRGEPKAPAYGAAKAGLNAMSQSLAQELAPRNIYVYAIAPGFIATDMGAIVLDGPDGDAIRAQSPMNRVGSPEEMAHIIAFLAGEGTDYMTGCIIDSNGASYLRT